MEKKINIWNLNFAFLLSIFLHIYLIFFLTKSDFNFLEKKRKVTITLSDIDLASRTRLKWPACNAPIVGTTDISLLAVRHSVVIFCRADKVRTIGIFTFDPY